MENNHDEDMYLFNQGFGQAPTPLTNQMFDDFLVSSPDRAPDVQSPACMNPNDLTVKPRNGTTNFDRRTHPMDESGSPAISSSSSSRDSSGSPTYRDRHMSMQSANSSMIKEENGNPWSSGVQGMTIPTDDTFLGDTDMSGVNMEQTFGTMNPQIAPGFNFDNAAAMRNMYGLDEAAQLKPQLLHNGKASVNRAVARPAPGVSAQFYFGNSRETSPLNAMLPAQAQHAWNKHSPSSGLEDTFNGITMNGDSPGNATFSPNLQFPSNGFSLEADSTGTPSTYTKDISSPPSTINSADNIPILTVYPTSLKSRVETQIPIRMNLHPLPAGIKKLKLPTHTVSKPKFLVKPDAGSSSDMLELHVSLVCSSAMQDPQKRSRAFARARGEDVGPLSRPSPESSTSSHTSKDDDDKPLNGGEVKICSGCIQRERKRASRKKQKKPDEEQLFQKDEERRVVVFNTSEIKEWVEPSKDTQNGIHGTPPPGAMQVELPMRIACYCRHQNEKIGFQVIFTVKDQTDKVIAQAMTNSIMITDDHKTHNPPPSISSSFTDLANELLPSRGSTNGDHSAQPQLNAKAFKQSHSTPDLQSLQRNINPQFPITTGASNPFAVPSTASGTTSGTMTPRNLSRPPSPGAVTGPNTKRRKQSSGKVPSMLAMTRLETSNAAPHQSSLPSSAAASPFQSNQPGPSAPTDRGFVMPNARNMPFGTSPPTPNSTDHGLITPVNRSFSLENLPRQGMISAPNSRHPSRPSSPDRARNSFGASDNTVPQAGPTQVFGPQGRRPSPLIHKLVPAEGSITGGTEVTLLGNGFYQGLEVMFGDTEATTTTFWGEKCLNCIAPPAIQPGTVAVVFKHEHPQYSQMPTPTQSRPMMFTYIDDREVEMYRLALKTLGRQLQNPTNDPYLAAQQLLGGSAQSMWAMQNNFGSGGGQHRQARNMASAFGDVMELETNMLVFLEHLDTIRSGLRPSLDFQRPSGHTLLHLACSFGMTHFVAGLLGRGANPNMLDNNGNTPMHLAAMSGHTHIVHRLRLAGADRKIRSIRNFLPADLATSLLTYQASSLPNHHYRSRSAGGTPMRLHSRNNSSTSLASFWDSASLSNAYSETTDESDDGLEEALTDLSVSTPPQISRRRPSTRDGVQTVPSIYSLSRQASGQRSQIQPQIQHPEGTDQHGPLVSPAAYMMAWRDQLASQIQQYQQSVNWALPNLPALPSLPAMPAMPDYQDHPMVRRVSAFFPQRTASRPSTASNSREGWWESLTGSSPSSPPAYEELFPNQESQEDYKVKTASAVQAAGDAVLDRHYETLEAKNASATSASSSSTADPRASTTAIAPIRRREIKQIKSDRKLFLFWVSDSI